MGKNYLHSTLSFYSPSLTLYYGRGEVKTYTAACHQRAIKLLWLHFWGALMFSIIVYSRCKGQ